MAKAGKDIVGLECEICKTRNYVTTRNKINLEGKLSIAKFCKICRKKTLHKENTRLK